MIMNLTENLLTPLRCNHRNNSSIETRENLRKSPAEFGSCAPEGGFWD